jgi:hypothetical protein
MHSSSVGQENESPVVKSAQMNFSTDALNAINNMTL